jgi:hypothetical protein
LKLWLLDAEIIIDLLELNVFDTLVRRAEIFTSETVAGEVISYQQGSNRIAIDFKAIYVRTAKVIIRSASVDEINAIRSILPGLRREGIDLGELESLAVLQKESSLTFCSCDAAAIRALPFIGCSERGISAERLFQLSGVSSSHIKDRHKEDYFQNNLRIGKELKIQNFGKDSRKQKTDKGRK